MTATTADAPATREGPPGERVPTRTGPQDPGPTGSQTIGPLAAELSLAAVTLVATLAFLRLFDDADAVLTLLLAAAIAHLVCAVTRRAGLAPVASLGVVLVAATAQISLVLYPHTSFAGIPTGATLTAIGRDLDRAWTDFSEVIAPAPSSRGFLLAASLTLWVAVTLADWAGLRLRATAEAVLPAGAVVVFCAILGNGGGGVVIAALLVAAIATFALVQRLRHTTSDETWVGAQAGAGAAATARTGTLIILVVAVVAGLVAPMLPGASSPPVIDIRGGDGAQSRVTVSPLVDIRSRLVRQSDTVAFSVEATRPAYWRLTSLDRFDGDLWSSSESFSEVDGRLPSRPPDASTSRVRQSFTIFSLDTIWAPAALTPVQLVDTSTDLRWNGELATLIVPGSEQSVGSANYTVISEVPDLRPEDLDRELPRDLPDALEEATALPDDVADAVRSQARAIVSTVGPRPYERALALQEWFRTNFTYNLAGVPAGHSDNAIEAFLESREGYCEQFAGTFAAMARSLGIPARVAVGFTWGEVDEDGLVYTVRGRNAHAWPEVFIPGAGWVAFEPTPGRGQPGARAYTGVTPEQVAPVDPGTSTTTTTTTTPSGPGGTQDTFPRVETVQDDGRGSSGGDRPVPLVVSLTALLVVASGVGYLVVLVVVRQRRRLRRRHAHSVPARIQGAWADVVDALARSGIVRRQAETDREFARRASPVLGPQAPALLQLAQLVTATAWAPAGAASDAAAAHTADALARDVSHRVLSELSWSQRVRSVLDPRLITPRRGADAPARGRSRFARSRRNRGHAATR